MSEGFWTTPSGKQFVEETVPTLIKLIERLCDALESILAKLAMYELGRR
jgi:hypothetical protein